MRLALVSLQQAWENKEENFSSCRAFVQKAKAFGSELVIFPEMTLTAFSMNTAETAEDPLTSKTVEIFKSLAHEFRVSIVFGVVFRQNGKSTNNAVWIDATGTVLGSYSKIHPFSFSGEDRFFTGGEDISTISQGSYMFGMTICYDLRFPELYTALGRQCDLIINIANWPARRIDHWNVLLRARAIENQLFMVGVNRTGMDGNGLEYVHSSMVVDPNGVMLQPVIAEPQIDIYDIDISSRHRFMQSFSTTQDRKVSLYKKWLFAEFNGQVAKRVEMA